MTRFKVHALGNETKSSSDVNGIDQLASKSSYQMSNWSVGYIDQYVDFLLQSKVWGVEVFRLLSSEIIDNGDMVLLKTRSIKQIL